MIEAMGPAEVHAWLEKDESPILLDVRTPEEYERVRIPGAYFVPLALLPLEEARIPKDRPIVCVCHSGARSYQAARWLAARRPGQRCVNLEGGIVAWAEAGLPLEIDEEVRT